MQNLAQEMRSVLIIARGYIEKDSLLGLLIDNVLMKATIEACDKLDDAGARIEGLEKELILARGRILDLERELAVANMDGGG